MEFTRPIASPETIRVLERIASSTPSQPILLLGADGMGKGTVARWLVAHWLCDAAARPCGQCSGCRQVMANGGVALTVLDAAEGGTVAALSRVHGSARFTALGGIQISLIEHLDRASPAGIQGLLKLLEEGPARSAIVLTAVGVDSLPSTVMSRCLPIYLPPVPDSVLARTVTDHGVRGAAGKALLEAAAGRPGVLLRLLSEPEELETQGAEERTIEGLCRAPLHTALAEIPAEGFDRTRVLAALAHLLRQAYSVASPEPRPRSIARAAREFLEDADANRFSPRASAERMLVTLHGPA